MADGHHISLLVTLILTSACPSKLQVAQRKTRTWT